MLLGPLLCSPTLQQHPQMTWHTISLQGQYLKYRNKLQPHSFLLCSVQLWNYKKQSLELLPPHPSGIPDLKWAERRQLGFENRSVWSPGSRYRRCGSDRLPTTLGAFGPICQRMVSTPVQGAVREGRKSVWPQHVLSLSTTGQEQARTSPS